MALLLFEVPPHFNHLYKINVHVKKKNMVQKVILILVCNTNLLNHVYLIFENEYKQELLMHDDKQG